MFIPLPEITAPSVWMALWCPHRLAAMMGTLARAFLSPEVDSLVLKTQSPLRFRCRVPEQALLAANDVTVPPRPSPAKYVEKFSTRITT